MPMPIPRSAFIARRQDQLRPFGRVGEPLAVSNTAIGELQDQAKPRALALLDARLEAIVVDLQRAELRHQTREVRSAPVVPLPDPSFRHVEATASDARLRPRDVAVGAVQSDR